MHSDNSILRLNLVVGDVCKPTLIEIDSDKLSHGIFWFFFRNFIKSKKQKIFFVQLVDELFMLKLLLLSPFVNQTREVLIAWLNIFEPIRILLLFSFFRFVHKINLNKSIIKINLV